MKTTLLFNRNEGVTITTFAVVTFTSDQTKDPKVLMEKFKSAVTKWIASTDDGDKAWKYSCGDFNIGDYASHDNNTELNKHLSDENISVEINLMNDADAVLPYDTILANEDDIDSE